MKIEKISENQIRCTLTKTDLDNYEVKLSELAYGTEKARNLFQEMMEQAQLQCGFEVDNTPLMIEAIPLNMESIILVITKVEDPEELDTRFSKFAPFKKGGDAAPVLELDGADDILDFFRKLADVAKKPGHTQRKAQTQQTADEEKEPNLVREFHFSTLDHAIDAAHSLKGLPIGESVLYKDREDGYLLYVQQGSTTPEEFNKLCNILSEYGTGRKTTQAAMAFMSEQGDIVMADAVRKLASLPA